MKASVKDAKIVTSHSWKVIRGRRELLLMTDELGLMIKGYPGGILSEGELTLMGRRATYGSPTISRGDLIDNRHSIYSPTMSGC